MTSARLATQKPAGQGRKCSARSARTKLPCRRAPILGGNVCLTHGGRAPQVQRSARERLLAAAVPAASALIGLLKSEDEAIIERAARAILDRSGHGPESSVALDAQTTHRVLVIGDSGRHPDFGNDPAVGAIDVTPPASELALDVADTRDMRQAVQAITAIALSPQADNTDTNSDSDTRDSRPSVRARTGTITPARRD